MVWLALAGWWGPFAWARPVQPQRDPEFLMDVWEAEDGLPDASATAIAQTPDGYLWVGTFSGLTRFDGSRFTVFNPDNTPEMPSTGIVNLHSDSRGWLWVSTFKGMARMAGGRWESLTQAGVGPEDYVRTFAENAGVLAITSFNGRVFRFTGEKLTELPAPPGEPGRGYLASVDADGKIWVIQHRFFGWWDGQAWRQEEALADLLGDEFYAATAKDGGLWFGRASVLCKLQAGKVIERRALSQPIVNPWSLTEDSDGDVWVASYLNGLYRIKASGEVLRYTTENGLSHNGLRFVFQDREGNHWVGSGGGGGLARFKRRAFVSFGEENGLEERVVKSVAEESSGDILVATYGRGVARLSAGRFTPTRPTVGPWAANVQSLLVDRHGRTWIGSYGQALTTVAAGVWSSLTTNQSGGANVTALFEDSRGNIWIGGNYEVLTYSDREVLGTSPDRRFQLPEAICFAEDQSRGAIWAGSDAGLFSLENDQVIEQRDERGRGIAEVNSLYAQINGVLWVAAGRELLRLERGRWTRFRPPNGLPVPLVTSLTSDDLGYLWLGSHSAVARVNLDQLERYGNGSGPPPAFQVFTGANGLLSADCPGGAQPATLRDHRGRLWFATLKGVSMVEPRQLQVNTNPPPIFIEQVRVEDRANGQRNLLPSDEGVVEIPPGLREVAVFFTALCYTAPEKTRFAYKIEGLNDSWSDIGSRRSLYFYPPPPGNYRLRVKAANSDGVWNESGASVGLLVLPFYWQTLWFRALALTGFAGGASGSVWWLLHAKIRRQQASLAQHKARAEAEARYRAFVTQSAEGIFRVGFHKPLATSAPVKEQAKIILESGYVLESNDAAARVRGLATGADVLGSLVSDFTVLSDQQNWKNVELFVTSGYRATNLLTHGRDIHGRSLYFLNNGTAVIENGFVQYIWIAQRDVTEQRQALEKLQESEARFRQLASAAWEGIAISENGRMVDVNDQLAAMFGLTRAELIGQPVLNLVAPESRDRVLAAIQNEDLGPYDHLCIRRDGVIFPVEVRAQMLRLGNRSLRISAIRDITAKRQSEQALRELARRLMRVQDQERRRIGRELHDSTGQTLAALEITLALANRAAGQLPPAVRENLAECAALAGKCASEIRTASYLLHPPLLEELGLASALRWLVDGFSQRSGIEVSLDLPANLPRLGEELELSLFRVAQEALTNVHRHSGSPKARVRLRFESRRLELSVEDDGQGIAPDRLGDLQADRRNFGVGVSGMRERLRQLGGDLTITSGASGTRVQVTLVCPEPVVPPGAEPLV